MNLGQAVAVCLYEVIREGPSFSSETQAARATSAETARLEQVLLECLQESGYVKPQTEAATKDKVRQLLRRLHLESEDAESLVGMLRKVLWKMKPPSPKA